MGNKMNIKLVFADWQLQCRSIYREKPCLSMGDFHSGTTFNGSIELDCEQEAELRSAIEKGYQPVFWVAVPNSQVVEIKTLELLPPREGLCQECGADHPPEAPHNQQSIYYQYRFHARNGRWPTWRDAMAHCDEETKRLWHDELARAGEEV